MTCVDIYCRTAADDTETQRKLEEQEAFCRAYCQEHDLTIGMIHAEAASGTTYQDREQLSLLRQRYTGRLIKGVVVTDLFRLSQSYYTDLPHLINEMRDADVILYCVKNDAVARFLLSTANFILGAEEE